jgi:energy-coupling factor transport system substrate-specific component
LISRRTVALAATLGTLAALSRVPFAAIPNVQPASALVVLAGATLGAPVGALAGGLVPLVSNAFLGHGPWTLFQAIGWAGMGAGAALLARRPTRWVLAAYGALAGLAFGAFTDVWVWLAGVRPLELRTLLPVLARGLPFNLAHAAGNAVILAAVGPRLVTLLERADAKRRVVRIDEPDESEPEGAPGSADGAPSRA